ncbi:3997_t:CDS:2 [Paraglomus occultum]|uniref:3997_t:CDS:1 n=1 Tax=Paraglomus occultum TaxID=144539 RepID=A0A9N9FFP1_9GLOM|nr:3997_t:CDS:2 [Paraglomus occultum]
MDSDPRTRPLFLEPGCLDALNKIRKRNMAPNTLPPTGRRNILKTILELGPPPGRRPHSVTYDLIPSPVNKIHGSKYTAANWQTQHTEDHLRTRSATWQTTSFRLTRLPYYKEATRQLAGDSIC